MLHLDSGQSRPPTVLAEQIVHAHRRPGRVVGDPHVASAAGGDGQAQGMGRLLQGGGGVGHLNQQQVEVVGAQSGQTGVQCVQQ